MSEIEFVKGLFVKPPHEKAPEFVKCSISIKVQDLQEFLSTKQTEWVNIDVKVSAKSGQWFASVNNWKPEKKGTQEPSAGSGKRSPSTATSRAGKGNFVDDDIPF